MLEKMLGTLIVAAALAAMTPPAAAADDPATPDLPATTLAAPSTAAAGASAQRVARSRPARSQGDSLRVFLLTFGPGAAVWERFGHNALWIHDPAAGTDVAYHYGLFDMSEEGFLVKFLQGRMFYSMGSADATRLIQGYRQYGRDVTIQELRLTAAQTRELQTFLRWNLRPENRVYRYDYFRDNCSTRVRDALDQVMGGALRTDLEARPSPFTYRSQAVALTAEDALLTTGMDLGLGPLSDEPLTRWELGYIPMRLRDDLRSITVARNGGVAPVVVSERYLPPFGAADPDMAEPPAAVTAPNRIPALLLVGLLAGTVFALLGLAATRTSGGAGRTAARWGLAALGAVWGLLSGVLGWVLLALWTLTDHEFAWRNENLLQADPLALGLVVLVPLAVLAGRARTAASRLALVLAGLSVVGLLLHPLPLTRQANLPVIALLLPIHLGLLYALRRVDETELR